MRGLLVVATLLLVSAPARAETYSFQLGGRTVHVGVPQGCADWSCVSVTSPRRAHQARRQNGKRAKGKPAAQPPAQVANAPNAAPGAPAVAALAEPPKANTEHAPIDAGPNAAATPNAAPAAAPAVAVPRIEDSKSSESKTGDAAGEGPKAGAKEGPKTAADPGTPAVQGEPSAVIAALPPEDGEAPKPSAAGKWRLKGKEGYLRIEPCGANVCGFAEGGKHDGKMLLINMRPTKPNAWSGRVRDLDRGHTYSAQMTVRGEMLRIEGCALGGMFCGNQTLTRAN